MTAHRDRPRICLIDDEQWLDRASAQALGFAARRLAADPVGVVFAARDPSVELAGPSGRPFSVLACAVLASLADLQADALAPSWLVRVRTCLALHFPGANLRLYFDCPGLLIWEPGRRLFAILPGPAAKQAHSAAEKTHSVIIGCRLADFPHLGLRGRSAGRSTCVSCPARGDRTSGPTPPGRSRPCPPLPRRGPCGDDRRREGHQRPDRTPGREGLTWQHVREGWPRSARRPPSLTNVRLTSATSSDGDRLESPPANLRSEHQCRLSLFAARA